MLLELKVKDLGIIEELNWHLSPGLNVITGETGAGKSLVVDAVEALLGGKVDEEAIRYGAEEARIEGIFALPQGESVFQLKALLAEKGLSDVETTLILNYELRRTGRSIARVNGQAVTKGLLNMIGHFLIDIHGQSDHLSLLDRKYQLDFLDSYAHTLALRNGFSSKAVELLKAEQELKSLAEKENDIAHREEFLHYQLNEIRRARLREGEEEELVKERNVLSFSEKLKELSYAAYQALYGNETSRSSASSIYQLNETIQIMKNLVDYDPTLRHQLDILEENLYGLEEVARDIRSYSDRLEPDPKRLEEVESRLEVIKNLKRKYGQSIAEILDFLNKAEKELEGLTHSLERRAELGELCSSLKHEMGLIASELSEARSRVARQLANEVKKELQELNMSQVAFDVYITRLPSAEGIPLPDGEYYAFTNEGVDSAEFTAATNPGEPFKPLARIASTGEISRFMLALKGALSEVDDIPVLIFDEIDIGVGGRSGEIIGKKLWNLARKRQVICVTHLPQIAVFADAHHSVYKELSGTRTLSNLKTLQGEAKSQELAIMLAGPNYTEVSLNSARELMRNAELWKNERLREPSDK